MTGEPSFEPTIDPAEAEAAIEAGRKLFAAECRFFFGAQKLEQLPPPAGTEIAFAGRSNVGKSSLLNALTGGEALARASQSRGARGSSISSTSAAG